MKTTKTQIRFFTVADHEEEQEYLNRMHRTGWKIVRVGPPCFYHFEACEPENVVYQLDYYQERKFRREEYLKIFEDCGWEYLFDFMDYHYFRKPAAEMEGNEEIFCDDESRLDMMKRVFRGRIIWLLVLFFVTVVPNTVMSVERSFEGSFSWGIVLMIWIILFALYVFLFIRFAWKYYVFKKRIS